MGPSVELALVAEVEPPAVWPQAIMIAPARKFSCLSIPFSWIVEQSNPTGTSGSVELVIIWYFPSAFAMFAAGADNTPALTNASKAPVATRKMPIKKRGLKKADCEADLFFMGVGGFECSPVC